jgi:LytS/YehU family sensor histidine kinase
MVGIAFAIKTVQKWLVQQNEKHEMEKKNLETELSLLKSQLHPHFLFNTMNNLYALSLEQSSKTSEGIAKLSALLRSVLYECNEKEIPLAKEIELLGNYIDLEEIRYDNLININFEISGEVDKVKIAPMLLFTFAENCFKHSDIKQNEEHYIKMKVVVNRNKFDFYAENSKLPGVEVGRSKKEGIGLNNVSKRLELIYPGKHSLKMTNLETKFIVRLSINLL